MNETLLLLYIITTLIVPSEDKNDAARKHVNRTDNYIVNMVLGKRITFFFFSSIRCLTKKKMSKTFQQKYNFFFKYTTDSSSAFPRCISSVWYAVAKLTFDNFSSVFEIIVSKDSRWVNIFLLWTFLWNVFSSNGRDTYKKINKKNWINKKFSLRKQFSISFICQNYNLFWQLSQFLFILPVWIVHPQHRLMIQNQLQFLVKMFPKLGIV